MNSSSASAKISRSSASISSRTRSVISARRSTFEPHPEQLHLAQHRHQRQLDVAHQPLAGRARRSARAARRPARRAAPLGRRPDPRRRSPGRALRTARRTDSRAAPARAGRRRAACRARAPAGTTPSAFASCATTARSPQASATCSGPRSRRRSRRERAHLAAPPARPATAKRHGDALGEQRALGRLAGAAPPRTARSLAPPATRAMSAAAPARTRAVSVTSAVGAGAGELGVAERLLQAPQRVAQLVLAEDLAHARAVGLARGLGGEVEVDRHVALDGRELLGDARVLGVLDQVLFALGAADLVDVREHAPRASRSAGSARSRSCRRCRGRRGCCRRCRPSGRRSRGSARAGCRSGRSPPGGRRSSSR